MSHRTNFSWEFACPKFVDFEDPKFLELEAEAESYFDLEHEFSFSAHNISEGLKVESILAQAESMGSPIVTPSRPTSSASNYRTPPDGSKSDLESDEVFYTTRKSYSLRDTECRRLKQIGASPYRIPGGTTTSKKKSRRAPFQPKLVEENAKQIEEEILVENLKKALFFDGEENDYQKEENSPVVMPSSNDEQSKENSYQSSQKSDKSNMNVTQSSNDYSMELMAVSQDIVYECVASVLNDTSIVAENEQNTNVDEYQSACEEVAPIESTEVYSETLTAEEPNSVPDAQDDTCVALDQGKDNECVETSESLSTNLENCEDETIQPKSLPDSTEQQNEVATVVENEINLPSDLKEEEVKNDVEEKPKDDAVISQDIPKIRVSPSTSIKSSSTSSDEGYSKSNGGFTSDNCWTDVDEENIPTTSGGDGGTQEKRRRPLRRESFVKSSATLASTIKKVDPQKRLYRLLSYTAPPKNKYRSMAELSRDFETKIRAYTPPNLKATRAQWTPTKPISPKLTACKRKRTLTCVSLKDQEENIAQSIKKNTFKATPFNKKTYLSTVNVGVKRVDPKPTTKPIPFSFRSEKRIEARRSKLPADLFNKLTSDSTKKAK